MFFIFFVSLIKYVNAAPSNQDLYNQCAEDYFVSSDIAICLAGKLSASEKVLEKELKRATNALDEWDIDKEKKNKVKKNILESNREFKKYKKDYCNFSMSMLGGSTSNSYEIQRLACLISVNMQYIEQIEGDLLYVQPK
ncbi:lysozyme inhibitor LprI family protein [Acetobacter papayae]|uniref:lysozyme inhibitor LprI family protein n=1 Tax=Acetobacter papayae TaxID=1076592 RepID=UPI0039EB686F